MLKALRDKESGLAEGDQFKREFIRSQIKYRSIDSAFFFRQREFTVDTVVFLTKLMPQRLLDIYMNTEQLFSVAEALIFQKTVMATIDVHCDLVLYVQVHGEELSTPTLIALMNDHVLFTHIPLQVLHNRYTTDPVFAREVIKRPDILDYLRKSNRNLHFIWNHPQIDIFNDDIGTYMRGCHV